VGAELLGADKVEVLERKSQADAPMKARETVRSSGRNPIV
jgi:hypothetical protein